MRWGSTGPSTARYAKPGVNAMTRARVLSIAESLGYRPNLAARYLSRGSSCASPCICPRKLRSSGTRCAKASARRRRRSHPALHVDFRSYPSLGEGRYPLFEEALRDGTNGLIIAPGNPDALKSHRAEGGDARLPVVRVVTDAPEDAAAGVGHRGPFHGRGSGG